MDWSQWVQGVAGGVVTRAADAKWVQPYEIQKLQLQALGQLGMYQEGQAQLTANRQGLTISPAMLLIGAGLVAVLMMKD